MKLRMSDGMLRIRITPEDASRLQESGECELSIPFALLSFNVILRSNKSDGWYLNSSNEVLIISIPQSEISPWLNSDAEGIEHTFNFDTGKTTVKVQKEYPCDHKGVPSGSYFSKPKHSE